MSPHGASYRSSRPSIVVTAAIVIVSVIFLSVRALNALPTQVHAIIAFEAAMLPDVPSEVRSYLGNPEDCLFHSRDTVCEGTYDEDADIDPRMESDRTVAWLGMFNSGTHFWNPDGGPAGGLLDRVGSIPVNRDRQNAYQRALGLYGNALDRYRSDPHAAYYLLGRAAHLLGDMATPAHVHLDPHISDNDSTGDDSYEEFLAGRYVHHDRLTGRIAFEKDFPLSGLAAQDLSGLPSDGFEGEHPLFRLFLSLARLSQTIDSDDAEGTLDRGSRQGGSITLSGSIPEGVSALSGMWELPLPKDLFGFSRASNKLVISGPVLNALDAASPFTQLRLHFDDRVEDHALSEFTRSDISDERAEPSTAVLVPSAISHIGALYQLFWKESHPDLSGHLPRISLSRTPRELRVIRPAPVTIELDIDPAGWRDSEVEVYLWVHAPVQQGRVQLYFDGQWHSFSAFAAMRPLAAPLQLRSVDGLLWTPLADTSTLPDLHFTMSLCLDRALDGVFTPEQSVCGAVLVVLTGESG